MKKIIIFVMCFVMLLTLFSCNSHNFTEEEVIHEGSVSGDTKMYLSLKEINEAVDCIIVGSVTAEHSCVSTGYEVSDFDNFEEYRISNPSKAAFMHLSITTPYTINVEEVISAKNGIDISANNSIFLYQPYGQIKNVRLNSDAEKISVGEKYILFLKQHEIDNVVYYYPISEYQGTAEIVAASSNGRADSKEQIVSDNSLFKNITTIDQVKQALK